MKSKEVLQAIKAGKEVVVVAAEMNFDSAIFWKRENMLYSFSVHLGIVRRSFSEEDFKNHIDMMLSEDAHIFTRGVE